jgi:hypothetical protein
MIRSEEHSYEATLTLATKSMRRAGLQPSNANANTGTSVTISNVTSQNSLEATSAELREIPTRTRGRKDSNVNGNRSHERFSFNCESDIIPNNRAPDVLVTEPPSKRLKSVFPNARASFSASEDLPGYNIVLIGESDPESD